MTPEHYSRDIVARCESLICHLLPKVEAGLPDDSLFGGPLRTTFLLAMATPMIILPIDRILKPKLGHTRAGNDMVLDKGLAGRVADVLGGTKTFGESPFASNSTWNYVPGHKLFNIAGEWPSDLLSALGAPKAIECAKSALAQRILCDLRNSLAHGGITYLDKDGNSTKGPAAMLAFAGAKEVKGKVVGLNILRIRQSDFRAFLTSWANWVGQRNIAEALNSPSNEPNISGWK